MADRYLLESGSPDGYLLEDGSGVLLLDAVAASAVNFRRSLSAFGTGAGKRQLHFKVKPDEDEAPC